MPRGRRLSKWTANEHRFLQSVRNEKDQVKWATFCIHENAWFVLDSSAARIRIKEYNEHTPSPQPPFSLALVNTGKQQWRINDASDDENTAPAEQQQQRSPLQQILLAPVMAMMAMASPSKSKGSLRNDKPSPPPDSPEHSPPAPRSQPRSLARAASRVPPSKMTQLECGVCLTACTGAAAGCGWSGVGVEQAAHEAACPVAVCLRLMAPLQAQNQQLQSQNEHLQQRVAALEPLVGRVRALEGDAEAGRRRGGPAPHDTPPSSAALE